MFTLYVTLFIFFLVPILVSSDLIEEEGKRCMFKETNQIGLCINIDRCDHAKNLLKLSKWKRPQFCGNFIGIYPLVCCPTPRSEIVCQTFHPPVEPCIQQEISGGEKSVAKEFPHMAALGYGDKPNINWFCGGSLISEQFILTAAHCLKTKVYGPVRYVRLGDLDLTSTSDHAQPQDFTVLEAIPHPKYKPPVHYHDIALLKLDRPARFSVFVQPACLHVEVPIPKDLTITGWGKVDLFGSSSSHLLKANLFYVNHTTCVDRYSSISKRRLPNGVLNDIQVCAGHPEGKDTCPGDSGGPLQYKIFKFNPHFRIVGVTSFGQGCGLKNSVAIYARVSEYYGWIEDVVWPENKFSLTDML